MYTQMDKELQINELLKIAKHVSNGRLKFTKKDKEKMLETTPMDVLDSILQKQREKFNIFPPGFNEELRYQCGQKLDDLKKLKAGFNSYLDEKEILDILATQNIYLDNMNEVKEHVEDDLLEKIIFNSITVSRFIESQFGKSNEHIDYYKFYEIKREDKDYEFFNLNESTFNRFNEHDDDGIALLNVTNLAQHFNKDEISNKIDNYDWICHQAIAKYCDECIKQEELLEIVPTLVKGYDHCYDFNESDMCIGDLDDYIKEEFLGNENLSENEVETKIEGIKNESTYNQ